MSEQNSEHDGNASHGASHGRISRRAFLTTGAVAGTGLVAGSRLWSATNGAAADGNGSAMQPGSAGAKGRDPLIGRMGAVGKLAYDGTQPNNPLHFISAFNETEFPRSLRPRTFYKRSTIRSEQGESQTLHEYLFVAIDKMIEIVPGVYFPAWTYNGQVPGPTLRASQGDRIRIWFINQGSHPHTIHFHGWHPVEQDGAMPHQFVKAASPNQSLAHPFGPGEDPQPWLNMDRAKMRAQGLDIYEFDADPVGVHLYHCHSVPLKRHIHKGLYGVFIVDPAGRGDPKDRRPKIDPDTNEPLPNDHPVRECVMMLNGFDTNFDDENEVYALNSIGFAYQQHPIPVRAGELVRMYVVNITEFDPINSLHLHAGFFRVYRTGTNLQSQEYTDTVMFSQAERAILECRFRTGWPGKYMFHAHQSEFAELGWMSFFEVTDGGNYA